jgi:hypothetical protein
MGNLSFLSGVGPACRRNPKSGFIREGSFAGLIPARLAWVVGMYELKQYKRRNCRVRTGIRAPARRASGHAFTGSQRTKESWFCRIRHLQELSRGICKGSPVRSPGVFTGRQGRDLHRRYRAGCWVAEQIRLSKS